VAPSTPASSSFKLASPLSPPTPSFHGIALEKIKLGCFHLLNYQLFDSQIPGMFRLSPRHKGDHWWGAGEKDTWIQCEIETETETWKSGICMHIEWARQHLSEATNGNVISREGGGEGDEVGGSEQENEGEMEDEAETFEITDVPIDQYVDDEEDEDERKDVEQWIEGGINLEGIEDNEETEKIEGEHKHEIHNPSSKIGIVYIMRKDIIREKEERNGGWITCIASLSTRNGLILSQSITTSSSNRKRGALLFQQRELHQYVSLNEYSVAKGGGHIADFDGENSSTNMYIVTCALSLMPADSDSPDMTLGFLCQEDREEWAVSIEMHVLFALQHTQIQQKEKEQVLKSLH